MHELGIVFHVIKSVEKIGEENGLTNVASVTLELGEVSGAIPHDSNPRRYVLRGLRARLSHRAVWPHLPALRQ